MPNTIHIVTNDEGTNHLIEISDTEDVICMPPKEFERMIKYYYKRKKQLKNFEE